MASGNKPVDDGNYLFTPQERLEFLAKEPLASKWFKIWLGGEEFINGIERWCLWLGDCPPADLRSMPEAIKRVQAVKSFRQASSSLPTKRIADTPTRFHTELIPQGKFLALPQVSSERRAIIPIAFLDPDTLCGDKLRIVEGATLFHFGVLNSSMHMAWAKQVCGRLKSDYQYSALIVYNNYPWPEPADKQRKAVEDAAQAVLNARAACPGSTLADLYDPLTMPPELVKAHQALDRAVDAAYGRIKFGNDGERVAFLFELYQKIAAPLDAQKTPKTGKVRATRKSQTPTEV
jgi:hypothetical protein